MFFRDIILTEKVKNFRDVSGNQVAKLNNERRNLSSNDSGAQDEDKTSFASGDVLSSIGSTHPEMIDHAKLEAIALSQNIVEDFNNFFDCLFKKVVQHNKDIKEKYFNLHWEKSQKEMNVVVHTIDEAVTALAEAEGCSYDQALQYVKKDFLPGSLTEEGCRQLIKIRLQESKAYNTMLRKMIEVNYKSLNLSEAEAKELMGKLDSANQEDVHQAQGKLKEILSKRKNLRAFKVKDIVYDFRSAGGGVLMITNEGDDQRFNGHPPKMLGMLSKYDAVVLAHGGHEQGFSKNEINEEFRNITSVIKNEYSDLANADDNEFANKFFSRIGSNIDFDNLLHYVGKKYGYNNQAGSSVSNTNVSKAFRTVTLKTLKQIDSIFYKAVSDIQSDPTKAREYYNDMVDDLDDLAEDSLPVSYMGNHIAFIKKNMAKLVQSLGNLSNDDSSDDTLWSIQSMNTLNANGITDVVTLCRQLKKEGFKNVILLNCNPGHHKLPKDIENDNDFNVSFGKNSVYKETGEWIMDPIQSVLAEAEMDIDYFMYKNNIPVIEAELPELFDKYAAISEQLLMEIDKSTIKSKLIAIGKKAVTIIANIWKAIVRFFRNIFNFIMEKIKGSKKSDKKTKKPFTIASISISGGKAKVEKATVNSEADAVKIIANNTQTIKKFIDAQANKELKDSQAIRAAIESGKFRKKAG